MNKKMFCLVCVLVLIAQSLGGCCNRCKNKSESSVSTAGAGQVPYAATALDQSSTYTTRNAIK